MLKLNKEEVHFLVTAEMKKEVADFLEEVDGKIAPVLEYIKENQDERVCFIGCGSSSAGSKAGQCKSGSSSKGAGKECCIRGEIRRISILKSFYKETINIKTYKEKAKAKRGVT